MHVLHRQILKKITEQSGKATHHTFLENYLGNSHPRYAIGAPALRNIAKEFAKANALLTGRELEEVLDSLFEGKSFTEKVIAGVIMDYLKKEQRVIRLKAFERWLGLLEGWAEIDAMCTGKYMQKEIPSNLDEWDPFLKKLARNKNIAKRRASLVFICSPISHSADSKLASLALQNIDALKEERHGLITKAISWLLRSMIRYHRHAVEEYVDENAEVLPAIAVRETRIKLKTGKKTATRKA